MELDILNELNIGIWNELLIMYGVANTENEYMQIFHYLDIEY